MGEVDLSHWDFEDTFSFEQIRYLAAGVDPSATELTGTNSPNGVVVRISDYMCAAIRGAHYRTVQILELCDRDFPSKPSHEQWSELESLMDYPDRTQAYISGFTETISRLLTIFGYSNIRAHLWRHKGLLPSTELSNCFKLIVSSSSDKVNFTNELRGFSHSAHIFDSIEINDWSTGNDELHEWLAEQWFHRNEVRNWLAWLGWNSGYAFAARPSNEDRFDEDAEFDFADKRGVQVPTNGNWPWGNYSTKKLDILAKAVERYWNNYDTNDPDTADASTNEIVTAWLVKEHEISENLAKAIATIIRADGLPEGRRKKNS